MEILIIKNAKMANKQHVHTHTHTQQSLKRRLKSFPRKVFVFLLTFSLLFSQFSFIFEKPAYASASWYNSSWRYRKAITVDNSSNASALTNYQAKVTLSSSNFDFSKAQSTGADIRFTDNDGTTLLDYWIEFYDSTNQKATVWVEVPSIAASSGKTIYMYYGNSAAITTSNGVSTFVSRGFDDFEGYNTGSPEGQAPAAGAWSKYASNPVLSNDQTWVSVIKDGSTYKMYYSIGGTGDANYLKYIGLAISTDGLTWTDQGAVMNKGSTGQWDANGVWVPDVWKEGSTYHMMYTGRSVGGVTKVGHATSSDGATWTKDASNPVFNATGTWADNCTENSQIVKIDGTYYLWFSNLTCGTQRQTGVATSTDLVNSDYLSNNPDIHRL